MTVYARTWRKESQCDPCTCFAQRADYASFPTNPPQEFYFNLGLQKLCRAPFIWPFIKKSAGDPLMGDAGYYPMGVGLRGAFSPNPGSFNPSSETVRLSYIGTEIFRCVVTHEFVGVSGASWVYQNIQGSPAPVQPFKMRYRDALSIANQLGVTINQFFGEYTQDPNNPTGPIGLTGFVYTGPLDETQDKILHATTQNIYGPPFAHFTTHGLLYYGPRVQPPLPRV